MADMEQEIREFQESRVPEVFDTLNKLSAFLNANTSEPYVAMCAMMVHLGSLIGTFADDRGQLDEGVGWAAASIQRAAEQALREKVEAPRRAN